MSGKSAPSNWTSNAHLLSVSSEEQAKFTPIIDSILAASDLTIISEKRIRKGLQAAVEYDLTEKKVHDQFPWLELSADPSRMPSKA